VEGKLNRQKMSLQSEEDLVVLGSGKGTAGDKPVPYAFQYATPTS
jgi:hypothetical protein